MMIPESIDSHQHYWQPGRFNYSWLTPGQKPLYRQFMPEEARSLMNASGIERCILVQAVSSYQETAWLLELAEVNPFIAGVVGWADLLSPTLNEDTSQFLGDPRFRGVRPEPPQPGQTLTPFVQGVRILQRLDLTCDFLTNQANLPVILSLVAQSPDNLFILDHLAGLPVTPDGWRDWRENMGFYRSS